MTVKKEDTLILNENKVRQKIRRIAFQIYEQNFNRKELILAGIFDKGYVFAELLQVELEKISPLKIHLLRVDIDKIKPESSEVNLSGDLKVYRNQCLVLVDDVLNTGKTLAYSLKALLQYPFDKIETAVLVNRNHQKFPISSTYTGYELSTTINEHIEVQLDEKAFAVHLF